MNKSQIGPVFNALDGQELITVILNEIREKLEATNEFRQHRAFPLIKLTFSIGVASYPSQELDAEPKIKTQGEVTLPKGVGTPAVEPAPTVTVEDTQVIDTPDRARRKANIPIKVPAPGPNKIHEDRPVPPKVKETKDAPRE